MPYPTRFMNPADDDLVILVLESSRLLDFGAEQIWLDIEEGSLQPDVKEIGGIGVLNHVVVGRIAYHDVD